MWSTGKIIKVVIQNNSSQETKMIVSAMVQGMFCCVLQPLQGKNQTIYLNGVTLKKKIITSKNSIITKTNNHNRSIGKYFSYGNKAFYGLDGASSVSQYTYKRNKDKKRDAINKQSHFEMEYYSSQEISNGINHLCRFLPHLRTYIAPVISCAYNLQNDMGDIQLKKNHYHDNDCWQSCICHNAATLDFHIEQDCTYTTIVVPKQSQCPGKQFQFLFKTKTNVSFGLPMNFGLCFVFSGYLLTHRQHCHIHSTDDNSTFINIASYGNKRLFNHMKQSLLRI